MAELQQKKQLEHGKSTNGKSDKELSSTKGNSDKNTSSADTSGKENELEAKAENGDDASQLEYAKQLLHLVKQETDTEKNGKMAVDLLVKASQKANDEATTLLRECVKSKTGITKENTADVKWCLETSALEKRVRESSRKLFREIHKTDNDREPLSFKDYVTLVKETDMDITVKRTLILAGKEVGEDVTEEKLSTVLSEQIQGTLNMTSSERENQSNEFQSADVFTKVTKFPTETLKVAVQEAQDMVSSEGMSWVGNLVPTNQLYMISAFFLYSYISASFLLFVIPLLVFYVTLVVLLVTTLQIIINRQNLNKSMKLAKMLHQFDTNLDVEASRSKFLKNKLTPYWVFFAVLPLCVAGLALASKKYIPCSDLAVVSCIVMAIIFFFYIETPVEPTRWIAMFLNLISAIPTILRNFPEDVPMLSKVVRIVLRAYSFDTGLGLKVSISFPSISYALLPVLFFVMALRHSGAGSYRILLPFLVTQVWFTLATTLYPYSTWFGLLRASVGNAFLPVLLPISILGSVLYGIYQAFQTSLFIKIAIAAVLGLIPLILSQTKDMFGSKEFENKTGSAKKYIMLLLGIMAFLPVASVFSFIPSSENAVPFNFELDWDKYNSLCTFGDGNRIQHQNLCRHFTGQKVVWNGTFKSAQISQVVNTIEPMLTGLPTIVVNKIRCNFGTSYGNCNDSELYDVNEQTVCKLKASVGQTCHFNEYDTYSFQLLISMPQFDGDLTLDAGDSFKEILGVLKTGDSVEVVATLGEGQGTMVPKFQLKDIRCTSRVLPVAVVEPEEDEEVLIARATNEVITTVVNFLWYPVLEYSPKMV